MTDNDLNKLITDVARQMTDVNPPVHLHGRVLARLDQRPPSPWIWRLVVPATAVLLAVVSIGVVVVRRTLSPRDSAIVTMGAGVTPASPQVTPQTSAAAGATTDNEPRRVIARQGGSGTQPPRTSVIESAWQARTLPSAEEVAWQERAIPALIHSEPVALAGIQPKPLEIRPLNTAPLAVAPMSDDINKR